MKWVDAKQRYVSRENLICGGLVVGHVSWNASRLRDDPPSLNYIATGFMTSKEIYGESVEELKPQVEAYVRKVIKRLHDDMDESSGKAGA